MDPTRFDRIAAMFAERRMSRRRAVTAGTAGIAAAGLTATGLTAEAAQQDATPADASPVASGETGTAEFLFVQSYQSGGFTAKDGSADTFTLTLSEGIDHTVYFSDRPERVVGTSPTAEFLERFPFGADDPPNAALVLQAGPDDTDVVVMELTAPSYDEATRTATYDAKVLSDYDDVDMTFQEDPKGAVDLQEQFGSASLFIDDCPDGLISCYDQVGKFVEKIEGNPIGMCWDSQSLCCRPCQPLNPSDLCNQYILPCNKTCTGQLYASFDSCL